VYTDAQTLSGLIRSRALSPVELVAAVVDRARRLQPVLNCFITTTFERAIDEARLAEAEIIAGRWRGPLHGIPFTVKDLVNTAQVRTTFGTLAHQDNVPAQDALSVARLRTAGAIMIGKTTTPSSAPARSPSSPLFGNTLNPWDPTRTCGSSGGAAAAVACGIAPLAVATDGGGSTRIPAACCGVVGIEQSVGVIPHSQAQDLFGNQTYVTPMTRTVTDTALMMEVMAGPSDLDPWSLGLSSQAFMQAVSETAGSARTTDPLLRRAPGQEGIRGCDVGIRAIADGARRPGSDPRAL
jgi:aspartyl-tRNA(Asn)/glutamyl-tRNA(Gln) amidotransferase subunit A